ncbi:MAG: LysR family transcriptional regulator [Lachnospiraceae bacterium]|nr:LysR family transcriptional regulator [Lachnospiraceae bacterium]
MNLKKTIDIRQIECFIACVQAGSASKAAEHLHIAQSGVSKMIKGLEESLGVRLFNRYARGMLLTREGEAVYQYASNIMENLKEMQTLHIESKKEMLHLSYNPSSWFADTFLEFYRLHKAENLYYQIYSAGTQDIVQRLESRKDDVGFVYLMQNQKAAFSYYLARNYLEFFPLAQTVVMLYPGKKDKEFGNSESPVFDMYGQLSGLRLIQRFPDEFSPDNYWDLIDTDGNSIEKAETVVTTNSEYIMSRMLQTEELSNISAAYLTPENETAAEGFRMRGLKEDKIVFGYMIRKGEDIPVGVEQFINYVKKKLGA